jgi:L-ascorbate metabolism protein UlaG (beta-lactamase superfamily)
MKLTFLGHSCFYLEEGNFKALIDPFITGNPKSPVRMEEFTDITHIFVTHGHGDHLGDAVSIAKATGALIITNHEIASYLSKFGVNVHSMHIGGRITMDFGTVKMTPALHGSGITTDDGMLCGGNPGGFIIEVKGKKVYHAGDTGLTMDMKLLEVEDIDLALIPIGGNFTMDIVDAARAVEFIKPKTVIPMHYNTFPVINSDPYKFKDSVKSSDVVILNPGDNYEF